MIYKGSRFTDSYLLRDTTSEPSYLSIAQINYEPHSSDRVYEVKAGDRLDLLAHKFYGDSQLHWIILYANPEYSHANEIESGDVLTIPSPERVGELFEI